MVKKGLKCNIISPKNSNFPWGMPPDPPSFICIYIPLHSIYISACTSIITALHVFYRCLGYHMYLPPLLYFVITPPPITLLYTYNTCIKSMCISCVAVIHCNTQAGFPPKILILDRTLLLLPLSPLIPLPSCSPSLLSFPSPPAPPLSSHSPSHSPLLLLPLSLPLPLSLLSPPLLLSPLPLSLLPLSLSLPSLPLSLPSPQSADVKALLNEIELAKHELVRVHQLEVECAHMGQKQSEEKRTESHSLPHDETADTVSEEGVEGACQTVRLLSCFHAAYIHVV